MKHGIRLLSSVELTISKEKIEGAYITLEKDDVKELIANLVSLKFGLVKQFKLLSKTSASYLEINYCPELQHNETWVGRSFSRNAALCALTLRKRSIGSLLERLARISFMEYDKNIREKIYYSETSPFISISIRDAAL